MTKCLNLCNILPEINRSSIERRHSNPFLRIYTTSASDPWSLITYEPILKLIVYSTDEREVQRTICKKTILTYCHISSQLSSHLGAFSLSISIFLFSIDKTYLGVRIDAFSVRKLMPARLPVGKTNKRTKD